MITLISVKLGNNRLTRYLYECDRYNSMEVLSKYRWQLEVSGHAASFRVDMPQHVEVHMMPGDRKDLWLIDSESTDEAHVLV